MSKQTNFKIILSPAKKINDKVEYNDLEYSKPEFLEGARDIVRYIQTLNQNELGKLLGVSQKLLELNYMRYAMWNESASNSHPAIFAFAGEVYRGINVADFSKEELRFINDTVFILSGLYGALRPLDLIQPYRLEMGTKIKFNRFNSLYQYWGKTITNFMLQQVGNGYLVNLASNEYSRVVDKKVFGDKVINIEFKEYKPNGLKVVPIYSKRARGLMTRFVAKNQLTDVNQLKLFDLEGYSYSDTLSSKSTWVFIR
ncbi:MAG: uncharacterized protein PWR03_1854 [Tenuifilum sp.]|jgi:hypothetical protein|uniref:UPF0246 protein FHG85_03745 n=1 Tax=Tenuifilum thalassicum TaxID=2590900 RepID=A0A7D3XD20_9BACT|nr:MULTISPECIES: peroxide stress protein YaaA [Tenuifilum]MDI3527671.1 uncharacterized protein [Tenuifilum sp.]QKG79412.1 peroxide stress protein YaaA [Tenuifilum thalassicum]